MRLAAAAAAAVALAIAGCALAPRSSSAAAPWPGRSMVLVAAPDDGSTRDILAPALDALAAAGVEDVVSALGQTVDLADFERVVNVPYLDAVARLVPGDPRRDPWISGLERYFTVRSGGRAWQVLYAAAPQSEVKKVLEESLGPEGERSWMIAERGAARARFLWTLPAAFAVVACLMSRRRRAERLLGSLIWSPLWWMGGAPAAAVAMLATLAGARASALPPRRGRDGAGDGLAGLTERLRRPLVAVGGPALAAFLVSLLVEPGLLPVALACALGQVAVFEAVAGLRSMARARAGRKAFLPVPIVPVSVRKSAAAFAPLSAAVAILALIALPLSRLGAPGSNGRNSGGIPIPVPAATGDASGRAKPLEAALSAEAQAPGLPALSDASAHRAFQRGVLVERLGEAVYGSTEPIVLQGFRRGTNGLVEAAVASVAAVADPAGTAYPHTSIEAMLAEAGEGVEVRLEALDGPGAPRRLALIEILVYILALVPFAASGGASVLAKAVAEAAAGKVREAA